jgi:pyruvate dehydrogenase E1 component
VARSVFQSITSPLIGLGQPGLDSYEPAFADELSVLMRHAFDHMQDPAGASVYLRLTTRPLPQPPSRRADPAWRDGVVAGAYWARPPLPGADLVVAYQGVVAPEAAAGFAAVLEDHPGAGLLAVTSADMLHRDWRARGGRSHIAELFAPLADHAGIVTLIDGSPATLSWLGGVRGNRLRALGVETFGQTGTIADLYAIHGLDADAVIGAAADLALA